MSEKEDFSRPFDEMLTLYELEPTICEVVVEGDIDVRLVEWFLRQVGRAHVSVVAIDDRTSVPKDVVARHGLRWGNRGRVLALSLELERTYGKQSGRVVCIADRDEDCISGRIFGSRNLLLTDYADMDVYLFNEELLDKFVSLYAKDYPYSGSEVCSRFSAPLTELYFLHSANLLLDWRCEWLEFRDCCVEGECEVGLDLQEFTSRFLNKNRMSAKRSTIEEKWLSVRFGGSAARHERVGA